MPKRPKNLSLLTSSLGVKTCPVTALAEEERLKLEQQDAQNFQSEAITEIIPNLFLGSHADALDLSLLQIKQIKWILNVAQECDSGSCIHAEKYLKIELNDHSDELISKEFNQAFAFINQAQAAKEGILVHCRRGISRSTTIVIAYLMNKEAGKKSFNEAYKEVLEKRPCINPNLGFVINLERYEQQLQCRQDVNLPSVKELNHNAPDRAINNDIVTTRACSASGRD